MDVREKLVGLMQNVRSRSSAWETNGDVADYLIAHGVTVQEWISVKDRLPTRDDANETESILAINKDENYVGRWIWDIVARWPSEFTYWMPLPQPLKGE